MRDTLSGNDDYGSGTGLASVTADVAITRQLLRLLSNALAARAPSILPKAERQLAGALKAIATTRLGGRTIAVSALPTAQPERIDAGVGAALETVAPIPDVLKVGGGS